MKIWTEKFRPKDFSELVGQEHIVKRIEAFVQQKNMPHVLFAGPAGVGKTTLSLIMARKLFGDSWKQNFLDLNASDDRGIDVVRTQIKDFARTKAMGDVPFKIILLDEADALTKEAQQSLRRTMEQYSNTTRFILSCVSPDTTVTLKDEIEVNIKHVKEIKYPKMLCANTETMGIENDVNLMCVESPTKLNNKRVIEIKTDTGRVLKVTDDHIIFAKGGWKCAGDLTNEDKVAVLPALEGTRLPDNRPILKEEGIAKHIELFEKSVLNRKELRRSKYFGGLTSKSIKILRNEISKLHSQDFSKSYISKFIIKKYNLNLSVTQISRILTNKVKSPEEKVYDELRYINIIPLTTLNQFTGSLCRIIGYLFGDGYLQRGRNRVAFVGENKTLERIKKEVLEFGFRATKIKNTKKTIVIKGRRTTGVSSLFYVYSKSFMMLLTALGVPLGNKCKSKYVVPDWILSGPKFIKREFLRGFFDAEMSTPFIEPKSHKSFMQLDLTQHKIKNLKIVGFRFLRQIQSMLSQFNVESFIKSRIMPYKRKDGNSVVRLQLKISATNKNLFEFFKKVGFYYDQKKLMLQRFGCEYLRYKQNVLNKLKCTSKIAVDKFYKNGGSKISIARKYGISVSLLTNQIEDKPIIIPSNFPTFSDWIKDRIVDKNSELVWNRIESIAESYSDKVYDLSLSKFHNFIGNGFILHNCNYSSKIIDPIQSRCSIFRFKPLEFNHVERLIERIAKEEGLKIDKKAIAALYEISNGDCRKMENIMQSCAVMDKKITEDLIYNLVAAAQPKEVKNVLEIAVKGDFIKARDKLIDVMLKRGLSGLDIIKQIQKEIWNLEIEDKSKVLMIEKCGEIEFRMVEGSDEFLQLETLLASFTVIKVK